MVSNSTLQLPFKTLLLALCWCNIKEKYQQSSEKVFKMLLLFQLSICVKLNFFPMLKTKPAHHSRLEAEANMRTQLCSIELYFKEICDTVNSTTLLTNFFVTENLGFFFIHMLFMLTF